MREITLTRGMVALVDDEDYDRLIQHSWHATKSKGSRTWYAATRFRGCQNMVLMHRIVLGAVPGVMVDHRDGNGLHNWRGNLRLATPSQNQANRRRQASRSEFKGVSFHISGLWMAHITVNRKQYATYHRSPEEAARGYDALAIKHFGEFARTNFEARAEAQKGAESYGRIQESESGAGCIEGRNLR